MSFIENIKQRAKQDIKTIILPEAEDKRVLESASKVIAQGFAKVILLGNKTQIENDSKENNIDLTGVEIIDIPSSTKKQEYAQKLFELRQAKGMTLEEASKLIEEPIYYGMMMLKLGEADGLVSGAAHSTSNTLRPALQILKTAPNTKLVSAFFVMVVPNCEYGENGTFVFGDCGLNENPDSDQLAEIAKSSSESFELLVGKKAKVGMLSYSRRLSCCCSFSAGSGRRGSSRRRWRWPCFRAGCSPARCPRPVATCARHSRSPFSRWRGSPAWRGKS